MGKHEVRRKHNLIFPRTTFKCIRCGKCCVEDNRGGRRIVLTERDAEEISNAAGIKLWEFAEKSVSEAYPYVVRLIDGKCFFLEPNSRCKIYPHRPLVCKFYPFVMQKIEERYVFHVDPSCPGLVEGRHLDKEYFEKLVKEAERSLNRFTGW